MIHHLTCSKDTYITNKVIAGTRRATDANVGYASTIDLFKLHNESSMKDETGDIQEISRGLLEFDLDQLKSDLSTLVDTAESTLKIELVIKDVQGTQVAPSGFALQLYPLKQSFDEGLGNDVIGFSELQAANWTSGSLSVKWNDTDTSDSGSWNAPGGWWDTTWTTVHSDGYIATQTFAKGYEDLRMDITSWVKAYWDASDTDVTNNYGWILKFDSTKETDSKTYFVKRFASRHSKNKYIVPRIETSWSSYTIDDRLDLRRVKRTICIYAIFLRMLHRHSRRIYRHIHSLAPCLLETTRIQRQQHRKNQLQELHRLVCIRSQCLQSMPKILRWHRTYWPVDQSQCRKNGQ